MLNAIVGQLGVNKTKLPESRQIPGPHVRKSIHYPVVNVCAGQIQSHYVRLKDNGDQVIHFNVSVAGQADRKKLPSSAISSQNIVQFTTKHIVSRQLSIRQFAGWSSGQICENGS